MTCTLPRATICPDIVAHFFVSRRCAAADKIMYHDKAKALEAAEDSLVERGVTLWVYRCRFCGTWHLTHRDPNSPMTNGPHTGSRRPHSRKRGFKPRRR